MRRTCSSNRAAALTALLLALAVTAPAVGQDLVDDGADLLDDAEQAHLSDYHTYLLTDHDIDYRVVTIEAAEDIDLYAVRRFEDGAVGARSGTGRGLLLVVDPRQDRVRLEVGYALEGVYPDAFIAYVEHRQMVPFFRAGRVADGILATTELIITRAQRAAANSGFDEEAWISGSGGGGATVRARLGAGPDRGPDREGGAGAGTYSAGRTPAETLATYFHAMQARNADPALDLYSPATREMLRGRVITPAQMDNIVRTYRGCRPQAPRFGPAADRAVIRYPVAERVCAPWFFRRIEGAWRLDLTMMQRAIRFGRSNAWRFDPGVAHAYHYAFEDWRFDGNGFPVGTR